MKEIKKVTSSEAKADDGSPGRRRDQGGSERRAAVVGEVSIGSPTANALPNLLLPGQYHGQANDGYADPQLECVLET